MCVRIRIFEDLFNIAAGIFENVFGTARMVLNEIGDIVDLVANGDIARVPRIVLFDLSTGEGWKRTSRHLIEAAVGGLESTREGDCKTTGEEGARAGVLLVDDREKRKRMETQGECRIRKSGKS
jgi:hypothetical protein